MLLQHHQIHPNTQKQWWQNTLHIHTLHLVHALCMFFNLYLYWLRVALCAFVLVQCPMVVGAVIIANTHWIRILADQRYKQWRKKMYKIYLFIARWWSLILITSFVFHRRHFIPVRARAFVCCVWCIRKTNSLLRWITIQSVCCIGNISYISYAA